MQDKNKKEEQIKDQSYEIFENEISEMTAFVKKINEFAMEKDTSLQKTLTFVFKMLINLNTRIYKLDEKLMKIIKSQEEG